LNLNPFEPPRTIAKPEGRTFWRDPARLIAFAFGLAYASLACVSAPHRFREDVPLIFVLTIIRDVVTTLGIFCYATRYLDRKIDYRFWAVATVLMVILFGLGLYFDLSDSQLPSLNILARQIVFFAIIIGPPIYINILLALRLREGQRQSDNAENA
jgi:hypothetical protein